MREYLLVRIDSEPQRYTNKSNMAAVRGYLIEMEKEYGIPMAHVSMEDHEVFRQEWHALTEKFEADLLRLKQQYNSKAKRIGRK